MNFLFLALLFLILISYPINGAEVDRSKCGVQINTHKCAGLMKDVHIAQYLQDQCDCYNFCGMTLQNCYVGVADVCSKGAHAGEEQVIGCVLADKFVDSNDDGTTTASSCCGGTSSSSSNNSGFKVTGVTVTNPSGTSTTGSSSNNKNNDDSSTGTGSNGSTGGTTSSSTNGVNTSGSTSTSNNSGGFIVTGVTVNNPSGTSGTTGSTGADTTGNQDGTSGGTTSASNSNNSGSQPVSQTDRSKLCWYTEKTENCPTLMQKINTATNDCSCYNFCGKNFNNCNQGISVCHSGGEVTAGCIKADKNAPAVSNPQQNVPEDAVTINDVSVTVTPPASSSGTTNASGKTGSGSNNSNGSSGGTTSNSFTVTVTNSNTGSSTSSTVTGNFKGSVTSKEEVPEHSLAPACCNLVSGIKTVAVYLVVILVW